MAAATLIQHPSHSGIFSSFQLRKRSKPENYDPLLSPIRSARLISDDELGAGAETLFSPTQSSCDPFSSSMHEIPYRKHTNDAGPLKTQLVKHLGRRSLDQHRCNAAHQELTSSNAAERGTQGRRAKHDRSLSADKYLKTLHKRLRSKEYHANAIDLSLSMEENEKRLGFPISTHPQSPEAVRGFSSSLSRSTAHQRSQSANAIPASEIGFGPRADFMMPISLPPRPHTPLVNRHSFTEMEWRLCPNAVDSTPLGPSIDQAGLPQRAATFDATGLPSGSKSPVMTRSTSSQKCSAMSKASVEHPCRPGNKNRLSFGSFIKEPASTSQSTLNTVKARSHRSTAQSVDESAASSSPARLSTDRSLSFKRCISSGSKASTPVISEASRLAAVDLAREEFKQRQAQKAQRYEERDRKMKEKHDRKTQEQQHKKSDESHALGVLRAKECPRRQQEYSMPDVDRCLSKDTTSEPALSKRESSIEHVNFRHTPRTPPRKEKSETNGRSPRLIAWCKLHILHR
ncbi:MAG: hypothetical protein Q9159_006271 [Coniocarpon cinnabarinum]